MTSLVPGSYFGSVIRRRCVPGFTITESTYDPETSIPQHTHESAYLCAVLRGSYTETYGLRKQAYRASAVVLHPVGQSHADQFHGEGGRCLNIELSPDRLANLSGHPLANGEGGDTSGGTASWLVDRLYREFTTRDAAAVLALEGLALELLAATARNARAREERNFPVWLADVRVLLHERFTGSLTLDELARSAEVHPTHLARAFRRFFRCTVGQYVRRLRIEHACRKLVSGDMSLSEIALECGFYDHSQFTRTFRAHTGVTPSEYRRNSRR